MPISLDTDVGEAFIIDCARHTEGLLSDADVKSKWALSDAEWAALERKTPLLAHVRREREQRVTNGTAAVEAANRQFAKAPSILGAILSNDEMPPRHRIEAARELRAIAAGGLNDKRQPGEKLVVVINLGAGDDRMKFKYLLFWLAWAVQNPEKNPETVVVLKSAHQGTGKSTICRVMSAIFGEHARTIADKRRLFDRFNADLETAVFVEADEMLWAGDRSTADALKSMITSDTLTLEVKHGARWIVPNRFHMIMTTNHEHAVQAGVQDRRFFVLDVSAHKAQDECWFTPLYDDLENGGVEEFLWLLKRIKLAGWHPRKLPKTTEAVQQQRYSADSISDWAQACIDADMIVGALGNMAALNQPIASNTLYESYKGYCKSHPASNVVFGKAMTEMFGPSTRQQTSVSTGSNSISKRPRTYRVPDADAWQAALDRRLGITS